MHGEMEYKTQEVKSALSVIVFEDGDMDDIMIRCTPKL